MEAIKELRANGISAQLFPDAAKMKKQMNYANSEGTPFVAIIGETELANGTVTLKDMTSGEQKELNISELVETLK